MLWLVLTVGVAVWVGYDLAQRKHAILRNFPIIGHFRYWLEAVGPELRQYIVTGNDEERSRYIRSLFDKGIYSELDEMSRRVLTVAIMRYGQ